MSNMQNSGLPLKVTLTPDQKQMMEIARVGFMNACPFFCYYFYSEMEEYPTAAIPSAATDGRRVYYNPDYLQTLKGPERVFVLAHEVYHAIQRHPSRMKHYSSVGKLRNFDWDQELFNVCADYIINADLVASNIGMCNPAWLYDPQVSGKDLVEDLYEKYFVPPPPNGGQGGNGQQSQHGQGNSTYGQARGSRVPGKPDNYAANNGGRFDELREPYTDTVTGREDLPSESEHREAVARAAAAAKAIGKMPASFQRMVDEILEPQVSWREQLRLLITGRIGNKTETWNRPNRRRLVLNPIIIVPGRADYGAGTVVCAIDSSGSIGDKELSAFFAEIGSILANVRPRRMILIWCDAKIQRIDEASSFDELEAIRVKGGVGGGGTDFRPPFEWLAEQDIKPDMLMYMTDLLGSFPVEKPGYHVIWCATTEHEVPWGDVVRIKV
jgi:predicted metal-dependent peptidase